MEDVVDEMTKKAKGKLGDVAQSAEAESRPMVCSVFAYCVREKLHPGYTEPFIAINHVYRSSVLSFAQPVYSCELQTDEKWKHVNQFVRAFLI